jgi:hypothetical protein
MKLGLRASVWVGLACALALLGACQRQQASAPEQTEAEGTDVAALEASQAAEQLAALGGPANAEQRALYAGEFEASGALGGVGAGEGAWELQILNDYVQFTRPGLGQDGGIPGQRDFRERGMRVVAGPLTITLRAEACNLPNGVALPYSAHVLFEGVAYQGCAKQGISAASRASWATVLPDLLPAIDACLARVTEKPARVTIASVMEEGVVSVRLREADGGRAECIASSNGGTVSTYSTIADIDRRNGESDPEFIRAPGPPPSAQPCRTVEPVEAADGARLGWLVRRSC